MSKLQLLGFALLFFPMALLNAQTIDSGKSKASFEIKNLRINTVEGTFTGMQGVVNFDVDDLTVCSFDVCIDASTVDTGIKKRDEHLRKDDFFDVANHAKICFQSSDVAKTKDTYFTKGTLTMRGIAKVVEIPFVLEDNTFKGRLSLDRYDYEVGKSYGKFMVGNTVNIDIECVVKGL